MRLEVGLDFGDLLLVCLETADSSDVVRCIEAANLWRCNQGLYRDCFENFPYLLVAGELLHKRRNVGIQIGAARGSPIHHTLMGGTPQKGFEKMASHTIPGKGHADHLPYRSHYP